jgi:putative DNA primase/helicase
LRSRAGVPRALDLRQKDEDETMTENAIAAQEVDERATDQELLGRLAHMSQLEYERAREGAAKDLGIRVPALDEMVGKLKADLAREEDEHAGAGLREHLPWDKPVDGAALLDWIWEAVTDHIVLSAAGADAVTLWIAFTHAHDAFDTSTYLTITSPVQGCGKTNLLDFIVSHVQRPLPSSNITPAVVFRVIEYSKPTLLIDEADSFIGMREDMRGILNSGHKRAAAYVFRGTGRDHRPTRFSTWCPKAIALIGKLPPTLQDRSIEIKLKRKLPTEEVKPIPRDKATFYRRARKLARWADDNFSELKACDPVMPDFLHNRAADNWRPLFAIAEVAGGPWPKRVKRAAKALEPTKMSDDMVSLVLLRGIKEILANEKGDGISSTALAKALVAIEGAPWAEYLNGKPMTPGQLARLLKAFEISPRQVWFPTLRKNLQGYLRRDFEDALSRYAPT